MKNLTLKNLDKAKQLVIKKGYSAEEAENIALNAFAMVGVFGKTVEEYLNNMSDKEIKK
jgi:hypothetical protein